MRFYQRHYARDYEKRLSQEGYPGDLLAPILDFIASSKTIADVGAGTGFFTLPLARKGYEVIAVEPSEEMIEILKNKIPPILKQRITIICSRFEDWEIIETDKAISIHSIYPMEDLKKSIVKLKKVAKSVGIVVRADEGMNTLSELIRRKFKGRKRGSDGYYTKMVNILNELNMAFQTQEIIQSRITRFKDIKKEAMYYCLHHKIDSKMLSDLTDYIASVCSVIDGEWMFQGSNRDFLFTF